MKRAQTARRVLIIVSRDAPDLYGHLTYAFDGNHAISVILDRRRNDQAAPTGQADRRSRAVDTALRTLGWAVVRYPLEPAELPAGWPLPEGAAARA